MLSSELVKMDATGCPEGVGKMHVAPEPHVVHTHIEVSFEVLKLFLDCTASGGGTWGGFMWLKMFPAEGEKKDVLLYINVCN